MTDANGAADSGVNGTRDGEFSCYLSTATPVGELTGKLPDCDGLVCSDAEPDGGLRCAPDGFLRGITEWKARR